MDTVLTKTLKGLGHLHSKFGVGEQDLEENTELTLPIWLAKPLCIYECAFVKTPAHYDTSFKSSLNADPNSVSLSNYPYFYETGTHVSHLTGDEELLKTLEHSFSVRSKNIYEKSQVWGEMDHSLLTKDLSLLEKKLFYFGLESANQLKECKKRNIFKLKQSFLLADLERQKKRKRIENEEEHQKKQRNDM